jgi:hypothetical protein
MAFKTYQFFYLIEVYLTHIDREQNTFFLTSFIWTVHNFG